MSVVLGIIRINALSVVARYVIPLPIPHTPPMPSRPPPPFYLFCLRISRSDWKKFGWGLAGLLFLFGLMGDGESEINID